MDSPAVSGPDSPNPPIYAQELFDFGPTVVRDKPFSLRPLAWSATQRCGARRRGAGRPRRAGRPRAAVRSSSRGGDSGDPDLGDESSEHRRDARLAAGHFRLPKFGVRS